MQEQNKTMFPDDSEMTILVLDESNKTHPIQTSESDSVMDVKAILADLCQIERKWQSLSKGETELHDEQHLGYYGIKEGTQLTVKEAFHYVRVSVDWDKDTTYRPRISQLDSVSDIKDQIRVLGGIDPMYQILRVGDTELNDDHSLEEYGIKDGTELALYDRNFEFQKRIGTGKTAI